MLRIRFRMRTMLLVFAAAVVLIGSLRWWHDALVAEYRRQEAIVQTLEQGGAEVLWLAYAPDWLGYVLDERLFTTPGIVFFDHVPDDQVAELTKLLPELRDLGTLVIMGRQIIPHARSSAAGETSPVIEHLRRSNVLQITVDASIRGAPPDADAPPYTREDLKVLQAVLPGPEITWTEVN
ncbi:MAG TPA: hypothetical protein VF175_19460 [Lacipirellula sp.]